MTQRNRLGIIALACALWGGALPASSVAEAAATLAIVNNDGAGEGFNDPTPASPVGGNSGTTIGAQRLIAFQSAANIWGANLTSAVTILVLAEFDPLSCNASGAVLGSAGPSTALRDFTGAPFASTWYPVALANALHGSDLDAGANDISATFNSTIGTTCAFPKGWYYGLDGNPPSNQIDFVSVLLHELGHGLGFLTFVDLATGAKAMGLNDAFMLNLESHGASPPDFPSMSNAQRVAASKATGNLHWVGSNVRAASGVLTTGKVGDHVSMYAPNPQQQGSSVSHWDTALAPNQVMEPTYTGAHHDPVLELPLFQDIGWQASTPPVPFARNDLLADLGSSGLYELRNNTSWVKLLTDNATALAAGDIDGDGVDEAIAILKTGTWAGFAGGRWVMLQQTPLLHVATGDLDGNGQADIVGDFPNLGLYALLNNTKPWIRLRGEAPKSIATGDVDGNGKDDVVASFPSGTWVRYDAGSWLNLQQRPLFRIATGDLDGNGQADIVGDFAGLGVYVLMNNAKPWIKVRSEVSQGIATGDLDGDGTDEVAAAFASGTWVRHSDGSWLNLQQRPLLHAVTGDLDGNGKADIVGDFAGLGIFALMNNAKPWVRIGTQVSQGLASGGFD